MKDFPGYGRPRWRLGRWERNFGYRCVLTCAQIEIMQLDLPHTLYNWDKDQKDKKKNTVASDEVIRLQEKANREAKERREAKSRGEIPYTVEELFK